MGKTNKGVGKTIEGVEKTVKVVVALLFSIVLVDFPTLPVGATNFLCERWSHQSLG